MMMMMAVVGIASCKFHLLDAMRGVTVRRRARLCKRKQPLRDTPEKQVAVRIAGTSCVLTRQRRQLEPLEDVRVGVQLMVVAKRLIVKLVMDVDMLEVVEVRQHIRFFVAVAVAGDDVVLPIDMILQSQANNLSDISLEIELLVGIAACLRSPLGRRVCSGGACGRGRGRGPRGGGAGHPRAGPLRRGCHHHLSLRITPASLAVVVGGAAVLTLLGARSPQSLAPPEWLASRGGTQACPGRAL